MSGAALDMEESLTYDHARQRRVPAGVIRFAQRAEWGEYGVAEAALSNRQYARLMAMAGLHHHVWPQRVRNGITRKR